MGVWLESGGESPEGTEGGSMQERRAQLPRSRRGRDRSCTGAGRGGGEGTGEGREVSRTNDSETSGLGDPPRETKGRLGWSPLCMTWGTLAQIYGNCCFSPLSAISLNLSQPFPRQVATNHDLPGNAVSARPCCVVSESCVLREAEEASRSSKRQQQRGLKCQNQGRKSPH